MPISVDPANPDSTHHVLLTDGEKAVGLIAVQGGSMQPDPLQIGRSPVDRNPLKTTSGNSSYADFNYPYSVIAQGGWVGGRGNDQFEKDATRFADSYRVNTERDGKAFLGGREQYGTGLQQGHKERAMAGSMTMTALIEDRRAIARLFISPASFTTYKAGAWLRRAGTPGDLTIAIYSSSVGVIGSLLASATVTAADFPDTLSEFWQVELAQALVSGLDYYFVVYAAATDDSENHWEVGVDMVAGETIKSTNLTAWVSAGFNLYYSVVDNTVGADGHFFEYRGATYFVTRPSDGGAPKLLINGDRGAADSNAGQLDKLIDATQDWDEDEWVGAAVVIVDGEGIAEYQPWRIIVSNTPTELTVDEDWQIEHDTTTEYVIVGKSKWNVITGHGLTKPVTDVMVSNKEVIYFAQGDDTNIRRARFYDNAGTFTAQYADDGTNKATYMVMVLDATDGWRIWKGNNSSGNRNCSVAKASPENWGTDLTFDTAITVGLNDERMTGMETYVDGSQAEAAWVFTEGAPWYIQSGKVVRVPLREFKTVRNNKSGRASCVQNVYLFFNMGNSLERYFDGTLDDLGPNLGEGLPPNRQGQVTALLSYPGRVLAAIDAGDDGYSSVLAYNGAGWHEQYRAPKGERIYALGYQPVPGGAPDRLWIRQGSDLVMIPFPSETFDPTQDDQYAFTHEGALVLSWMNAGLVDAWKYYRTIKTFAEGLAEDETWLEADYRLDQDETWTPLDHEFTGVPMDEVKIGDHGVNGKRLQIRLRFNTTDQASTPVLRAAILAAVVVTPPKFAFTFPYHIKDEGRDLRGELDTQAAITVIRQLDEWAGTAKPLTMRCVNPLYDGIEVFLMPASLRSVESVQRVQVDGQWGFLGSVTVQEA